LLAAVELGRRLAKARFHERDVLNDPAIVADYLALRYSTLDQEILGALYLNARNHLIAEREVFRGTLSCRCPSSDRRCSTIPGVFPALAG
jgi:DNA repair protein RadC